MAVNCGCHCFLILAIYSTVIILLDILAKYPHTKHVLGTIVQT